ncbi:hypothetical protein PPL19_07136 [Pseudomonas psychrotolerans L19]|nr:hypothetical protein PPL19_07136 [Pseudomonas psychrotolerans L19]
MLVHCGAPAGYQSLKGFQVSLLLGKAIELITEPVPACFDLASLTFKIAFQFFKGLLAEDDEVKTAVGHSHASLHGGVRISDKGQAASSVTYRNTYRRADSAFIRPHAHLA